MANETISPIIQNSNSIINYLTYLSQKITDWIYDSATKIGLDVTIRWANLVTVFISLLILYITFKYIGKPLIKIVLVALFGIILLGCLIPGW